MLDFVEVGFFDGEGWRKVRLVVAALSHSAMTCHAFWGTLRT